MYPKLEPSPEDRSNLVQYLRIKFVLPVFYCDYDKKLFWDAFHINTLAPDITEEKGIFEIHFYTKNIQPWNNLSEIITRDRVIRDLCLLFKEYAINQGLLQMHVKDPTTGLWVDLKPELPHDLLYAVYLISCTSAAKNLSNGERYFHDCFSFFKSNFSALRKNKKAIIQLDNMVIYETSLYQADKIRQWLEPIPCIVQFSANDYKAPKIFINKSAVTLEDMKNLAAFLCRYTSDLISPSYNYLEILTTILPRELQDEYRQIIDDMWANKVAVTLARMFDRYEASEQKHINWIAEIRAEKS